MRRTALDLGAVPGTTRWPCSGAALDASAEALEVVRARAAPDAPLTLVNAPFHRPPRRRYGLVYASLSLPFGPPPLWARTWRAVRSRVAVGGVFATTLFGPREAGRTVRT